MPESKSQKISVRYFSCPPVQPACPRSPSLRHHPPLRNSPCPVLWEVRRNLWWVCTFTDPWRKYSRTCPDLPLERNWICWSIPRTSVPSTRPKHRAHSRPTITHQHPLPTTISLLLLRSASAQQQPLTTTSRSKIRTPNCAAVVGPGSTTIDDVLTFVAPDFRQLCCCCTRSRKGYPPPVLARHPQQQP